MDRSISSPLLSCAVLLDGIGIRALLRALMLPGLMHYGMRGAPVVERDLWRRSVRPRTLSDAVDVRYDFHAKAAF